jgi:hypothetical protein
MPAGNRVPNYVPNSANVWLFEGVSRALIWLYRAKIMTFGATSNPRVAGSNPAGGIERALSRALSAEATSSRSIAFVERPGTTGRRRRSTRLRVGPRRSLRWRGAGVGRAWTISCSRPRRASARMAHRRGGASSRPARRSARVSPRVAPRLAAPPRSAPCGQAAWRSARPMCAAIPRTPRAGCVGVCEHLTFRSIRCTRKSDSPSNPAMLTLLPCALSLVASHIS